MVTELRPFLPAGGIVTDPAELRTYDCDGLMHYRVVPALVVLPETAEQVAATVRACATRGIPFVARGSGTGLSGGALPHADGVLIVMSRMRSILEIDRDNQRALVEPGVINLQLSKVDAAGRLLLRAGPVQPAGVLDRRQRRGELRRRPLPQVRVHHRPRHRRRAGHAAGRAGRDRRHGGRLPGLRPARRARRVRGDARDRHQGHGAADPVASGGADAAGRLPRHRHGRCRRCRPIISAGVIPRPSR